MKCKAFYYQILTLILLHLLTRQSAALTATQIYLKHSQAIPINQDAALELIAYFTLQSVEQKDIYQTKTPRVSFALESEDAVRAANVVNLNKEPFYFSLLLDISGSVEEVLPEIQAAAAALVELAPENAHFAVYTLNAELKEKQAFTDEHDLVLRAIEGAQIDGGATCLFDSLAGALPALDEAAHEEPRRAVVVFTDGYDRRVQGQSARCSRDYDLPGTVDKAQSYMPTVPIYTVGFVGHDGELPNVLQHLAWQTGGRHVSSGDTDREAALQQILADFTEQWKATATIYPDAGKNQRAELQLFLDDGQMPTAPIFFDADKAYYAPSAAKLTRIQPTAQYFTGKQFALDLLLEDGADVARLDFQVTLKKDEASKTTSKIGEESGATPEKEVEERVWVATQPLTVTSAQHTVQQIVDLGSLRPSETYVLTVSAFGQRGNLLKGAQRKEVAERFEFVYAAPYALETLDVDIVWRHSLLPTPALTFEIGDQRPFSSRLQAYFLPPAADGNGSTNSEAALHYADEVQDVGNGRYRVSLPTRWGNYRLVVHEHATTCQQSSAKACIIVAEGKAPIPYSAWDYLVLIGAWFKANWPLLLIGFLLYFLLVWLWWLAQRWWRRRQIVPSGTIAAATALRDPILIIDLTPDHRMQGRKYALTEEAKRLWTIGREKCDVNIPGDRRISRQHAQIRKSDAGFTIVDLGSRNRTIVDKVAIPPHQPFDLPDEATIQLGESTFLKFKGAAA